MNIYEFALNQPPVLRAIARHLPDVSGLSALSERAKLADLKPGRHLRVKDLALNNEFDTLTKYFGEQTVTVLSTDMVDKMNGHEYMHEILAKVDVYDRITMMVFLRGTIMPLLGLELFPWAKYKCPQCVEYFQSDEYRESFYEYHASTEEIPLEKFVYWRRVDLDCGNYNYHVCGRGHRLIVHDDNTVEYLGKGEELEILCD